MEYEEDPSFFHLFWFVILGVLSLAYDIIIYSNNNIALLLSSLLVIVIRTMWETKFDVVGRGRIM